MAERVFGIDVSLYQRGMDFSTAKNEGVGFAIIKASEGDFADPAFEENYKAAKAAGLKVGAYHYLRAATEADAAAAAKFTVDKCLDGKVFEYPIFVDVEDPSLRKLTPGELTNVVRSFCDTLENARYWAGFYTNLDWYRNALDGASLANRYSFWFAYWGTSCPLDDCQMWQFGGETNYLRSNKISGVVCDQDYCFVDYPEKIGAKGLNGMKKAQPASGGDNGYKDKYDYIEVGDKVRLKSDAVVYGTTSRFASWVYDTVLIVREIAGNRVVVSTKPVGAVTGAVDRKYLVKA
ncbi:MAG: hypothetical protein IKN38_00795 [Clostridia bacterium]|nr:hypothetical protein [Clostridia bacterium]